jgi:hypothetical protein
MTYKTENIIDKDVAKVISHVLANLPVFDPEYPPEPTINAQFKVTRNQLAAWYETNFMMAIETNRVRLVATQNGFRIDLIPEREKQ